MSILWELYNYYLNTAKTIPGFIEGSKEDVPYDITELANNYCKAKDRGDENAKSQYISALMVRYWHMVPYIYETAQNIRVPIEDIPLWVYEGIEKACTYRGWLDSSMEVSKEERGAEKCINQAITSVKAYYFKYYNETKRKDARKAVSLDEMLEDYQDSSCAAYLGVEDNYQEDFSCKNIVKSYVDKKDILSALIVDIICFGDATIDAKVYRTYTDDDGTIKRVSTSVPQFSQAKLSRSLKSIDEEYINTFAAEYETSVEEVTKVVNKIKKVSRMCLSKYIKDSFLKIRRNKEVLALC